MDTPQKCYGDDSIQFVRPQYVNMEFNRRLIRDKDISVED